jgi:hypothetical protein
VCGTPQWVLVPHPPPCIYQPYRVDVDVTVHKAVFRILGVSQDVKALDKLNCAKRKLFHLAEFWGLNIPSLELDAEHAHYASFTATLANLITDYESESLGPMLYGLIRQKTTEYCYFYFTVGGPIAQFV